MAHCLHIVCHTIIRPLHLSQQGCTVLLRSNDDVDEPCIAALNYYLHTKDKMTDNHAHFMARCAIAGHGMAWHAMPCPAMASCPLTSSAWQMSSDGVLGQNYCNESDYKTGSYHVYTYIHRHIWVAFAGSLF